VTEWEIGKNFFDEMVKNKKAELDGITFFVITPSMKNKPSFSGPLLCLFTDIKLMESIRGEHKTEDLIYVPWHWDEVDYVEGKQDFVCIFTSEIGKKSFK
jgi:hypothetical protein